MSSNPFKRSAANVGRLFANPLLWIGGGSLIFVMPKDGSEPVSPAWWAEFLLYGIMMLGLLNAMRGRNGFTLSPRIATASYVFLSWAFGMVYEASLTVTGKNIGGLHEDSFASYVFAQGDYVPLAIGSLIAIRFFKLDFRGAFFLAFGIAMTEALVFMNVISTLAASDSAILLPIFLAYYALAYSTFIALPLLIVNPEPLWRSGTFSTSSLPRIIAVGFALAMSIRLFWGLVYGPFITWAFGIAPMADETGAVA